MATIGELLIKLGLDPRGVAAGAAVARGELGALATSASGALGTAAKDAEKSAGGITGAFGRVPPAVGLAGGAAVVAVAGIATAATHSAMEFQSSMTQIQNATNTSAAQADVLGQAITNASLTTDSSANTMAAALAPVAGELQRVAGGNLSAANATDVLKAAQDLHEGTNSALDLSLHSIVDTLLLYHKGTGDAASVADTFFQAQSQLGIPLDQTAQALQRLQPRLVGTGISFDQTLGLVREITPVVGTGGRALSSLGTVLQSLTAPSTTATKALGELGVKLTDSSGKFIGLGPALDRIQAAYAKLPATVAPGSKAISQATLAYDLFGKQAQIGAVLMQGGSKALNDNTAALTKTGTAAGAAERNSKTLADQEETLKATMSTMATSIGQALIPAVSSLAQMILPIVTAIAGWISGHKHLAGLILAAIGILGALAAALAVIGPIVGAIVGAFALLNPVTLLIGAIIVIVVLVATHLKELGAIVSAVAGAFANAIGAILGFVGGLVSGIAGAVGNIVGFFLSIPSRVLAFETQLGQQVLGLAGRIVSTIAGAVGSVISAILSIPGRAIGWVASLIGGVASAGAQFVSRIADMAGSVVATILGIPGRLLTGLVSGFANLAASVVKAFVHGIASIPSAVGGLIAKIPGVGLVGNLLGAIPHLQTGAENVPNDMVALIHQGEMVLPPDQATMLRTAARTRTPARASSVRGAAAGASLTTAENAVTNAEAGLGVARARLAEDLRKRHEHHSAILAAENAVTRAGQRLATARERLATAEERAGSIGTSRTARAAAAPAGGGGASSADAGSIAALTQAILAALRQQPLVGTLTINNPTPEPPGQSIANEMRAIGQLGLGSYSMPVPASGGLR